MRRRRQQEYESGGTAFLASRIIARIAFYVLIIMLGIFLAQRAFTFGYSVFHSNPMTGKPGRDVAVTVEKGMSVKAIGQMLESKDLIRDANVFLVQAKIYNYTIYPGTYVLNTSQKITDMVGLMSVEPAASDESEDDSVIPTSADKKG